jgi:hypothetical protein
VSSGVTLYHDRQAVTVMYDMYTVIKSVMLSWLTLSLDRQVTIIILVCCAVCGYKALGYLSEKPKSVEKHSRRACQHVLLSCSDKSPRALYLTAHNTRTRFLFLQYRDAEQCTAQCAGILNLYHFFTMIYTWS